MNTSNARHSDVRYIAYFVLTILAILFGGFLVNDALSAITIDTKELIIGILFFAVGFITFYMAYKQSGWKTRRNKILLWISGAILILVLIVMAYQLRLFIGVDSYQISSDITRRQVVEYPHPLGKTMLFPGKKVFVKLSNGRYWIIPEDGLRKARWYEEKISAINPGTGESMSIPKKYGVPRW